MKFLSPGQFRGTVAGMGEAQQLGEHGGFGEQRVGTSRSSEIRGADGPSLGSLPDTDGELRI